MIILCIAVSGQDLYHIIWTAVRRLKEIGLEVVPIVADGVSTNRKFSNFIMMLNA